MDEKKIIETEFGIGQLGSIPESTPMDDYEAEQILATAQSAQRAARAAELTSCVECHRDYTRRAYRTGIPGCAVLCPDCLEAYLQRTFHLSITGYEDAMIAKAREYHQCEYRNCHNRGYWDSDGAGYACEDHMGLLA